MLQPMEHKGREPPARRSGAQHFYVAADADGYVGAFMSPDGAARRLRRYSQHIPFLLTEYPLEATSHGDAPTSVYALPYQGNSAVAFASNDPDRVRQVQAVLARVGLAVEDDVEF